MGGPLQIFIMSKVYRYSLTFFTKPLFPDEDKRIVYLIIGEEIAKTTLRKHWQGYAEFYRFRTIRQIKDFFNDNTVHVEKSRYDWLSNTIYCSKESKLIYYLGNPCSPVGSLPFFIKTKISKCQAEHALRLAKEKLRGNVVPMNAKSNSSPDPK